MRVAVTGAGGQLGAVLVQEFRTAGDDVTGFAHRDLDVGDDRAVAAAMAPVRPELILNAAAWTDVDGAEDHPVDALNANAFGPRALAREAQRFDATLVQYSTDFVFDGRGSHPYLESDAPNPRSVYATSKLLGEWFAADAPRAYVVRVESLFGGVPGGPVPRGSVATILNSLRSGVSPRVFIDRTITPTYTADAAAATRALIASSAPSGVYHCVNSGACTWFEFARELAHRIGLQPTLTPIRMSEVTLRAARPQYCALSNEKLRGVGIPMPPWQDALRRFLESVRGELAH